VLLVLAIVCVLQEKLRKDHAQRMSSPLISKSEYEALFHAHVAALLATARKQYTAALEELIRPALVDPNGSLKSASERGQVATDWKAASEVLSERPCFQKLQMKELQNRWQAFVGLTDDVPKHGLPSNKRHTHMDRDREQNVRDARRSRR
jgi:hypothetical protein